MANCCDMNVGDVYVCDVCGLELRVEKACNCTPGDTEACDVPLTCCGQEMKKKT